MFLKVCTFNTYNYILRDRILYYVATCKLESNIQSGVLAIQIIHSMHDEGFFLTVPSLRQSQCSCMLYLHTDQHLSHDRYCTKCIV